MVIYVTKNGERHGPFSPGEVSARICSGHFAQTDLGWHEGLATWTPLSHVVASAAALPMPMAGLSALVPERSSGMAKVSFSIGLIGAPAWFVLLFIAGVAAAGGASEESPIMVGLGLLIFAGIGINVLGAVLGIIALNQTGFRKWPAVIGLALNVLEPLGIIGLMIVGWSQ